MEKTILYLTAGICVVLIVAFIITRFHNRKRVYQMIKSLKEANVLIEDLKYRLKDKGTRNGITDLATLKIAKEIVRIENNLFRMSKETPQYRALDRSLCSLKTILKSQGYEIAELLGKSYSSEMESTVVFIQDKTLPLGVSVIISVQSPQIVYCGKVIQPGHITVAQNT